METIDTHETPRTQQPRRRRRSKRLNGEGSVFQRADGRWAAVLSRGGGKRQTFYAASAEAARDMLVKAREAQRQGLPASNGRLTVGAFLERFLDERRARTRPQTMQHYENAVRRHIVPALGAIKLHKLTPVEVQAFLESKRAEVLRTADDGTAHCMSPMMVRHLRTVLKMAMRLAIDWRLITFNPVDGVRGPKLERSKINPLDADETRKLLATARGHPLGAIWLLVATLGLRRGEVLGLRWSDVDLDAGVLSVRVQLVHLDDETDKTKPKRALLVEPKSRAGVRDLRLAPALVDALKAHKRAQAAQQLKIGALWSNTLDLIFTTQTGTPLMGGAVSSTHTHLCRKAGVRAVRFHDLRHGAATMMLGAGVDLGTLSETLGHARPSFTLDVYGHTKRPLLDDATDKVAAVLFA